MHRKQLWEDTESTNAPANKRLTAASWETKIAGTLWLIGPTSAHQRPRRVAVMYRCLAR